MSTTRATTLYDEARKAWHFEIEYDPIQRTWSVYSIEDGWRRVVHPFEVGFPTARNIAIKAVMA